MAEFFSMGGYGAYVWPSYGMTAVVMAVLLFTSLRSLKATETAFDRLKGEAGANKKKHQEASNGDEA